MIQGTCFLVGRGIKLGLYRPPTYLIPSKRPVSLPQSTVAGHEPAVGILAAGVLAQNLLRIGDTTVIISVLQGAHILRVHDVAATKRAVTMAEAIMNADSISRPAPFEITARRNHVN